MLDKEKVIAMLKCIANLETVYVADCKRRECPYAGTECMRAVAADALALLKEQEPRTLHVMEIKLDTVYWMEQRNIETPWPVAMKRLHGNPDFLAFEDYYGETWSVSGYCAGKKGWRCWTAHPTDEQRREAAWHG